MQTRNRGNREAASVAGAEWASGRVADEAREWALPREPQNRDGAVLIAT